MAFEQRGFIGVCLKIISEGCPIIIYRSMSTTIYEMFVHRIIYQIMSTNIYIYIYIYISGHIYWRVVHK